MKFPFLFFSGHLNWNRFRLTLCNKKNMTSLEGSSPPVIHIPADVRRSPHVNDAYNHALDEHGPVIIVPRHGRTEYVIDHRYAKEVLTNTKDYTFEKAIFEFLHLGFIAICDNGHFVHDIDSIVESNVLSRMNSLIEQIFPIFETYFDQMENEVQVPVNDKAMIEIPDFFNRMQHAISHAMAVMILGPKHSSPHMASRFAAIAVAMASMTGLHENTHGWLWAPVLWVFFTGISGVVFTIIPCFFVGIVPALWKARHQHLKNGLAARHGTYVPLFDVLLVKHYHQKKGVCALSGFLWAATLCIGLMFASIHQTAVAGLWILIGLTEKQEQYLPAIRKQWDSVVSSNGKLSVKYLSRMTLLDSFIRETFRTKGDSWGAIRQTTAPVQIGAYVLPKNALCLVLLARAHEHPENHGIEAKNFDGFQWATKGVPAAQASPSFLSFGLGRWACPGRQLAIHEMKIMLYLIFSKFDLKVKQGSFKVTNTINTTSVPPEVTFLARRR